MDEALQDRRPDRDVQKCVLFFFFFFFPPKKVGSEIKI